MGHLDLFQPCTRAIRANVRFRPSNGQLIRTDLFRHDRLFFIVRNNVGVLHEGHQRVSNVGGTFRWRCEFNSSPHARSRDFFRANCTGNIDVKRHSHNLGGAIAVDIHFRRHGRFANENRFAGALRIISRDTTIGRGDYHLRLYSLVDIYFGCLVRGVVVVHHHATTPRDYQDTAVSHWESNMPSQLNHCIICQWWFPQYLLGRYFHSAPRRSEWA